MPTVHHALVGFLGSLEGFVGEVHGAAIVGLKNEETNGHGAVGLVEGGVVATEELGEGNEIAQRFTHFLTIDGNHIVVHPVAHHVFALRCHGLCYFTFVVWEHQVHATAVNIKFLAQIFASHCRTFAVPSRESVAPRRRPAHNVFGRCLFPQCEIHLVSLFAHAVELAAGINHIVEIAP